MCASLPKSGVIEWDEATCHGCGICELACSLAHDGVCSPTISRISLNRDPLTGEMRMTTCRQCSIPNCYIACPVDAIRSEPQTGARIISEKCIQCGECAKACPYNEETQVIKTHPDGTYIKCDLCYDIQAPPLCLASCPWGALTFIPAARRQS